MYKTKIDKPCINFRLTTTLRNHNCILEMLVTALLESVDLFITVFYTWILIWTKNDPNDPANPDDLTRLQR